MENNTLKENCTATVTVVPSPDEKRSIRKFYSKSGLIFLLQVALYIIIIPLLLEIPAIIIGGTGNAQKIMEDPVYKTVLSLAPPFLSCILTILLGVTVLKVNLKNMNTLKGFNGTDVLVYGVIACAAGTIMSYVAALLEYGITSSGGNYFSGDMDLSIYCSDNIVVPIIWVLFTCILAPIYEELVFRGILLQSLKKYNVKLGIIVSAVSFGLFHGNVTQFLYATALGIFLAIVTEKTNSILPAIMIHMAFNTSNLIMLFGAIKVPEQYYDLLNNNTPPTDTLLALGIGILTALRFICVIAGIILFILICVKKDFGLKRPTVAGKNRGWPILLKSVPWYLVIIALIFITCLVTFSGLYG